jgi:hypothetical protein
MSNSVRNSAPISPWAVFLEVLQARHLKSFRDAATGRRRLRERDALVAKMKVVMPRELCALMAEMSRVTNEISRNINLSVFSHRMNEIFPTDNNMTERLPVGFSVRDRLRTVPDYDEILFRKFVEFQNENPDFIGESFENINDIREPLQLCENDFRDEIKSGHYLVLAIQDGVLPTEPVALLPEIAARVSILDWDSGRSTINGTRVSSFRMEKTDERDLPLPPKPKDVSMSEANNKYKQQKQKIFTHVKDKYEGQTRTNNFSLTKLRRKLRVELHNISQEMPEKDFDQLVAEAAEQVLGWRIGQSIGRPPSEATVRRRESERQAASAASCQK